MFKLTIGNLFKKFQNFGKNFFLPKSHNVLLVGNGFDLAVGLKTSYSDFVMYLSIKVFLLNALLDHCYNEEYLTFLKSELESSKLDKRLKDFLGQSKKLWV